MLNIFQYFNRIFLLAKFFLVSSFVSFVQMTLCHTLLWNAVQKTYEASINIVVAVHHLKYQLTFPSATWFKTWNLAIITWYLIFVWGFGSFLLSKFRVWLTWHLLKYMYDIRMISLQNLLFSIYFYFQFIIIFLLL